MCSAWAGAAGNFSTSSGGGTLRYGPGRAGPGRSKHQSAPPAPQVPAPGGRAVQAGADAPPLPRPDARSPPPNPPPKGGRASDAPKHRPATPPSPASPPPKDSPGSRRGRPRQVPGDAAPVPGAKLGGERGAGWGPGPSAALEPARYLPRGRRCSSPASAPASQGRKVKEKQRPPRPGRSRRPVRPPPAGGSAPAPRGHSARAR